MRALTTLILQFVIKAWNFENFIIISQETIFLTKTFCTVTWLLTPAFFRLQNVFFQTMSNYIPLELQFTADQSFFQNYDLKMHGFQDTEGQSPRWRYRFSEVFFFFFFFFEHVWTYILLKPQFNAEQSFLETMNDLDMYGFQHTVVQSQWWRHHISNGCSYFSKYVNLYTVNFTPVKIFVEQWYTV